MHHKSVLYRKRTVPDKCIRKRVKQHVSLECPGSMKQHLIFAYFYPVFRNGILWYIADKEVIRYNELQRKVVGITATMLTKDLRELENDGLISR